MADYHKLSDEVNGSEADSNNGFESFQRQLNAFLEQEKQAAITGAEHGSNELQHRLDHFINNLQHKLDTFVEENPAHASMVSFSDGDNVNPQSERQAGQSEKSPAQPAKKQPVLVMPAMAGNTNSASCAKLISSMLIAASCAIAAILWFVWPAEQSVSPQLALQQDVDEHQVLLAPEATEIEVSKTVAVHKAIEPDAKKTGVDVLAQPALAAKPKTTGQHGVSNAGKAAQPKASVTVRLKVTASIGNIRNKPDRSGKVLFRLARGAVVTRLDEQDGWFKVRLRNGAIAWGHHSIFQSGS